MVIRKVNLKDIPKLWNFEKENRLYDRKILGSKFKIFFLWEMNNSEKEKWIKNIKREIRKKNVLVLVSENEKLTGYAKGIVSNFNNHKVGYIEEFFVTKKERGKGVSSELMRKMMNWFKDNKVEYIGLDVFAKNKEVIEIYKKFGFEPFSLHMKLADY